MENNLILKVEEYNIPEKIDFNYEQLKQALTEKCDSYKLTDYANASVQEAKADRATLNKLATTLDNKRKEVKKECLAPYNELETKFKELSGIIADAKKTSDNFIKEKEAEEKEQKKAEITTIFESVDFPFTVSLDKVWNDKWLNKSYSLKNIEKELYAAVDEVTDAVAMMQNLPDFGFEAVEIYKQTLDITKAVDEAKKAHELQKKKEEAQRAAEDTKALREQYNEIVEEMQQEQAKKKNWIAFEALLDEEQAKALGNFCRTRGIEIRKA